MPVLLIHAYQTVYNNKLHTGEIITGTWNIILVLGLSTRLKMWDKTHKVLRLCGVFTLEGIQLEWNVKTQFLFGTFSTWSSATCEMPGIQPFDHWANKGTGPDHRPHITEFQNARNVAPANHVSTRPHCQITSTKRRASSFTLRRHVILQINAPHARSIHQHILGWLFWAKCQVI